MRGDWSWRLPLILQAVPSLIVMVRKFPPAHVLLELVLRF